MEIKPALKEQYHAGLAMLAECITLCPDYMWRQTIPPRSFWRIALHAAYYTHLYLGQNEDAYEPWPGRPAGYEALWQKPWDVEPYELPDNFPPYTKAQVLDYIAYITAITDRTVDSLDLAADETGISWYPNMSKLSHQLLNLRHLQGHVGQLSELLMARNIETKWVRKAIAPPT